MKPLRLIQAQAEDLPVDESFDVVVCICIYHELPCVRLEPRYHGKCVLKKDGLVVF